MAQKPGAANKPLRQDSSSPAASAQPLKATSSRRRVQAKIPTRIRASKQRTGCEQCKRRKVKCDEQKPVCSRCISRGESCTGNFDIDTWQIERPWVLSSDLATAPGPALEDDTLRHWYNNACLIMAMLPPPANPLSYPLKRLLQRSRALRHAVQSVSYAHRSEFSTELLGSTTALQERNLAIVSLQGEIGRIQSRTNPEPLLQTLMLTSLILCVSSAWLDHSGTEYGKEFLLGISSIVPAFLGTKPRDAFGFYIAGLHLYCSCFSSYLLPLSCQSQHQQSVDSMAAFIARKHSSSSCHPVVGIASSLFPVLTQIGYYYRRVVETKQHSQEVTNDLRRRLLDWNPEDVGTSVSWLIRLAECYRDMGDIMLYQAQRLSNDIDPVDTLIFLNKVLGIVDMIDSIPSNDPMINTLGPMLLIAGSELPPHYEEQRSIVRQANAQLITFSKIPTYRKSIELVEEVWRLRSESTPVSWLELMLEQGLSLGLA
ncbi:Zn2-C6 fungal-type domain-containing protein [Fusarium acuminatum]|uniref:Zn2-C6 fungal-type domain-containing protein n=1 Tax=Fusarium acuminatum TaxID=5515 RepID=A0ABZ2XDN5_9HYPO